MLVKESYLRKIIRESLLLEAVYKQKQLKELSPELYSAIDKQFILIDNTQSLDNEKSAGRFFIDALYLCMQELLGEFDPIIDSKNTEFVEKVEDICSKLIYLFYQKEVTSSTIQSGETFRDYIYAFMTSPKNFMIKNEEGREVRDIISKLNIIFLNISVRANVVGMNRILQFKQQIKNKDTTYPFENELVDGKYLVVQPLNMLSSIFWARTNILGEDIVLPKEADTNWCTSRYESNMFNTYFVAGGTNLFYFLPKDDLKGKEKFCVGLTKIKKNDKEVLTMGGHTTVDFENTAIIPNITEVNDNILREVSKRLNVSMETLNRLVEEMASKEAMDKYKYISLVDLPQFKSVTNFNTLAPINQKTGKRNPQDLRNIKSQIDTVFDTYKNNEYIQRGYKPDKSIIDYMLKTNPFWEKEGIGIQDILGLRLLQNPSLTESPEFLNECVEKYKHFDPNIFKKELIFNKEFLTLLMEKDEYDIFKKINFENFPEQLKEDLDFTTKITEYFPASLIYFPKVIYNNKSRVKDIIKKDYELKLSASDSSNISKFNINEFKKSKLYNDISVIMYIAELLPDIFEKHFSEFKNDKRIDFIKSFPYYSKKENKDAVIIKKYKIDELKKMKSIYENESEEFKLNPNIIGHILLINPQADFTKIDKLNSNERINIISNLLDSKSYTPHAFRAGEDLKQENKKYFIEKLLPEERTNKKICEYLLQKHSSSFDTSKTDKNTLFKYFPDEIKNDKEFILRNRSFIYPFDYSEEILNDVEFLKVIIRPSNEIYQKYESHINIRNNEKASLIQSNRQDLTELNYWPVEIQKNEEICKFFIRYSIHNLEFLENEEVKNDASFMTEIINNLDKINKTTYFTTEMFYKYIGNELKNNKKFILYLVNKRQFDLFKVDKTFNDDIDIANVVINKNKGSKKNLSDRLKNNIDLLNDKKSMQTKVNETIQTKEPETTQITHPEREWNANVEAFYDKAEDVYYDKPIGGSIVDTSYYNKDKYKYKEKDDVNERRNQSRKLIMTEATLKMLLRKYL